MPISIKHLYFVLSAFFIIVESGWQFCSSVKQSRDKILLQICGFCFIKFKLESLNALLIKVHNA